MLKIPICMVTYKGYITSKNLIYYDIYFIVNEYDGIPKITELDKYSELKWFKINDIPNCIMNIRKAVLDNYGDNIQHS